LPTKDSTVIAVRVRRETIEKIRARLGKRKPTINSWLTWAISLGLRKHVKRSNTDSSRVHTIGERRRAE
jgi:hypothetical protein